LLKQEKIINEQPHEPTEPTKKGETTMGNKVYEIITEKIIEKLERGEVPWHQPWIGGYPKNLMSKKEYRGINVFLLGCQRYSSPYWVSYKQAQELGGNVRKGQHGTMVVFWKQLNIKDKDTEEERTIPFLRYYIVFNLDQCEGIDEKRIPQTDIRQNFQPIDACEQVVNGMQKRPDIRFEEPRAYYNPRGDFVNMPNKETFHKEEFFYAVLFHELGHSTGHEKRLHRKDQGDWSPFGSQDYSKEELVAEMTAAFLCGTCQIENTTIDNSAAYIKSWLKKLKDDPKMVVLAAAQAQRASDYILGVAYDN
jgi:antirestriction protein ArdC